MKIEIDLKNTEDLKNLNFEQLHKKYCEARKAEKHRILKIKDEIRKKIQQAILKEAGWWKIINEEGTKLGFGYGNLYGVMAQFLRPVENPSGYDAVLVEMVDFGNFKPLDGGAILDKPIDKRQIGLCYSKIVEDKVDEAMKEKGIGLPDAIN